MKPQRGFNLISLMIGTSLSLVSILAMLALYKNLIGISLDSIKDARQDGQIAASLLTAQHELLNAGFWNPGTPAQNLQLLTGARLSNGGLSGTARDIGATEQSGNALVWVYRTERNGTVHCAGLLVENGRFQRLQGASSCTALSQWSSTTWSATPLIETGQGATFFKAIQDTCWPYGKAPTPITAQRVKVTMTALTSTTDALSVSELCLPSLVF